MSGQNNDEKNNKAGRLTLPDFRTYCKDTIMKTLWDWRKSRHSGQRDSPEINSQISRQMIFNRDAKTTQWRLVFATNGFGKKEHTCERMKWDPYPAPSTEINSKQMEHTSLRAQAIKCSEKQSKALWHWIWQWFLRYDVKGVGDERKDKLDFTKIKHFYASKDTIDNIRRQPMERKKHLQVTGSGNRPLPVRYREPMKTRKQQNPDSKMGRTPADTGDKQAASRSLISKQGPQRPVSKAVVFPVVV